MCGLVGVFGNIGFTEEAAFEDLLQMDVIRGPHSTGCATVRNVETSPKIMKGVVLPTKLLQSKAYKKATNQYNLLMMGHNRWATVGDVNAKNSHPFRKKHITLAHNGTLHTTKDLPSKKEYDTDTEAITNCIAQKGIEKTWEGLNGPTVITYWDKHANTLCIISNEKRPFWWAYNEEQDVLIWASESWMIRAISKRRKIKLYKDTIYYPPKNRLFEFLYDEKEKAVICDSKKLKEWTWAKHNPGRTQPWSGYNQENFGYGLGSFGCLERHRRLPNRRKHLSLNSSKEQDDFGFPSQYLGEARIPFEVVKKQLRDSPNLAPNQMTLTEFRKKYKKCHFCEDRLHDQVQYELAQIVTDHITVCGSCSLVAEVNKVLISKEMLI